MIKTFRSFRIGVTAALLAPVGLGAQTAEPYTFAGTVVARDLTGISYETAGCIDAVSLDAARSNTARAGEILVQLNAQAAELALATAEARVSDLEAAVFERDLSITAAESSVERRSQERALVAKEFARNEQIFRRGLVNEATMEGVEARMMNANFAADQAVEALASAKSAKTRAEIALGIGQLELQSHQDNLADLTVRAPFDGVLLDFDPKVGDCVSAGAASAQIYAPEKKAVEVFVRVNQLVEQQSAGVAVGAPVQITRINGTTCTGAFTWIGTEADLEHQFVKSSIEVEETCAADLFLNEAVDIQTIPNPT